MNTKVVINLNGQDVNAFGQPLIDCRRCDGKTTMLGTKLCDGCWELERRIRSQPKIAAKILHEIIMEKL